MAVAKATLVQQIRHALRDTPQVDVLTGSYTAAGLTLTVADATKYDIGDELEFLADGDTFVVTAASGTTITTVAGFLGWQGSTNANHASGAVFMIKPAFRYVQIIEAIEETILELWPYAWKVLTDTVTPVAGTYYYDAATSTTSGMDLIDAVQRTADGLRVVRYGEGRGSMPFSPLERNLPTALAASTVGHNFPSFNNYSYTVAVRVRAKLTTTGTTNYDDLTAGNMADAVIYGAAARLVENTEIARVTQSDVSMGDATVQPGSRIRDGAYFRQRFIDKREMVKRELEVSIPRQPRRR